MIRPSCIVLASLLLLSAGAAAAGIGYAAIQASPATEARRQVELWQEQQKAQRDAALEASLLPAKVVAASIGIILLPLAGAAALGAVGLAAASAIRRRAGYHSPDARGLLPLRAEDAAYSAAAVAALGAFHNTQAITAAHPVQQLPQQVHHLHYAPRTITPRSAGSEPDRLAAPPPMVEPRHMPMAPVFGTLLRDGRLGNGQLLLGFDAQGAAIAGTWNDLYSAALAGSSGSGKSNTLRFLALQSVLNGAKLALADPHSANEQGLASAFEALPRSAFFAPTATTPQEIAVTMDAIEQELQERTRGKRGTPIILVVDEYAALSRGTGGERLSAVCEAIAAQGRKFNLFVMASSQIWLASRTPSELRDNLASAYLHRGPANQLRRIWPGLDARTLSELTPGVCLLARTTDATPQPVSIPLTIPSDVIEVARRLPGRSDSTAWSARSDAEAAESGEERQRSTSDTLATPTQEPLPELPIATPATSAAPELSEQEQEILRRLRAGDSITRIVNEVYGARSGSAFTRAAGEVTQLLLRFAPKESET